MHLLSLDISIDLLPDFLYLSLIVIHKLVFQSVCLINERRHRAFLADQQVFSRITYKILTYPYKLPKNYIVT